MIVTEEIEIKVVGRMVTYYRNLGYDIKGNIPFIVKVSDLSKGSKYKITVKCEICNSESIVSYLNYNKQKKNSKKYICRNCTPIEYKKTCMERYGVSNVSKLKSIQEKKEKTCMENYGSKIPFTSEVIKNKIKIINNERYGGNSPMSSSKIREKSIKTCLKKYGVTHISKSDNIKNKVKKTCMERYGVSNVFYIKGNFEKSQKSNLKIPLKKYKNTKLTYQGTYELDFLEKYHDIINITNSPTIKYKYKSNDKYYFPDFYIKELNLIIEIKSLYTYQIDLEKNKVKEEYSKKMGFNYLFIIDKQYTDLDILLSI